MSDSDVIHSDFSDSSEEDEKPAVAKQPFVGRLISFADPQMTDGEGTLSDYFAPLKKEDEKYEAMPMLGEQTTFSNGAGESFIESLPDGVLWQILRNQEDKALKSCLLVSNRFKQIINNNRHHLKKTTFYECRIKQTLQEIQIQVALRRESLIIWSCTLKPKEQLDTKPSLAEVGVYYTLSKRGYYHLTSYDHWQDEQMVSRIYKDVSSFYANEGKVPRDLEEMYVRVNSLEEGLEEHLTYLCSRVNFGCLHLIDISATTAAILKRIVRKCTPPKCVTLFAECVTLKIDETVGEEHLQFLVQTGPHYVIIEKPETVDVQLLVKSILRFQNLKEFVMRLRELEEDFFKVRKTHEETDDDALMEDELLLQTRAERLIIDSSFSVTAVKGLLQQFYNRSREINLFQFELSFPGAPSQPVAKEAFVEKVLDDVQRWPGVRKCEKWKWTADHSRPPSDYHQRLLLIRFDPRTHYLRIEKNIYEDSSDEDVM